MEDDIHETYSDGEEIISSSVSDDDLSGLTQNVKALNVENNCLSSNKLTTVDSRPSSSLEGSSRTSSPFSNAQMHNTNYSGLLDFSLEMRLLFYLKLGLNTYCSQPIPNNWNEQQNTFWPHDGFSSYQQRGNF